MKPIALKSGMFIHSSFMYMYYRGKSFRIQFKNIAEARSIIHNSVNIMAPTATASRQTCQFIVDSLCMHSYSMITRMPNRLNIKCVVQEQSDIEVLCDMVIRKLKGNNKIIVFCHTYSDTISLHEKLVVMLNHYNMLLANHDMVCEMFTRSTHVDDKREL